MGTRTGVLVGTLAGTVGGRSTPSRSSPRRKDERARTLEGERVPLLPLAATTSTYSATAHSTDGAGRVTLTL